MQKIISITCFVCFLLFQINAQNNDEITLPLNGNTDQWVKVDVKCGEINVIGKNRSDVYIKWEKLGKRNGEPEVREDGLKRISTGLSGLSIDQEDNIIEVSASSFTSGYAITVEVPTNINLDLSSFNAGNLSARNIKGTVNLDTYNGKIEAHQMSGTVTANTFNGSIIVEFDKVTPDIPLEFITYNGDVDITLPSDTKASFKMRTQSGEILTGFDMQMKKAKDIKPDTRKNKNGKTRKIILDGWIFGEINGGGPEIELENNWGDIYIRRKE